MKAILLVVTCFCAINLTAGNPSLMLDLGMNEGHGDVLDDLSGYHSHGRIIDGTWLSDKELGRYVLSFDGLKTYCFFNSGIAGKSISVWFRIKGKKTGDAFLIHSAGRFWSARPARWNFGIFIDKDMRLSAIAGGHHDSLDSKTYKTLKAGDVLTSGIWYNCVLLLGERDISLFLNGKLAAREMHDYMFPVPCYTTIGALYSDYKDIKGGSDSAYSKFFRGEMGEVKISDRILTANEIEISFQKGLRP